jgi:RNA polymerase sigma-70 factor (ECF subfamily)
MELLDILNPKDRSAVILRYWYDYSYDEIANSLSLSNSAVKSRLHRARKELASEWLEMQEESTTFERTQNEQTI